MKNTFFYQFLILAILVLANTAPVNSQNIIYDGNHGGETSIIRNYTNGVDIVYTTSAGVYDRFHYIDRNTLSSQIIDISEPFAVQDFVIKGDTLFFCGIYFLNSSKSSSLPVYGYFNINDVFFSGGTIRYWTFSGSNSTGAVVSLTKMDVTKTSYGDIHLMMLGFGLYFDGNNYQSNLSAIVDVCINALGNHKAYFHVDTTHHFIFDDVTFTDNHVIVTAHEYAGLVSTSYNIFYYGYPTSVGNNIFSNTNTVVPFNAFPNRIHDNLPAPLPHSSHDVLVANMTGGKFATLCYKSDATPYIILSTYQTSPDIQPIQRFIIPKFPSYKQLIYNSKQQTFYVINCSDKILSIKYPFLTTNTITTNNSNHQWLSIDNADRYTHEMLSGRDHSLQLKLWQLDESKFNSCATFTTDVNIETDLDEHKPQHIQLIDVRNCTSYSFNPSVNTIKIYIECSD